MLKSSIKDYLAKQKINKQAAGIANTIRTESKRAIALMRRDNFKEADKVLLDIKKGFKDFNLLAAKEKNIFFEYYYSEGVEEFVEAFVLYTFLTDKKQDIPKYIHVSPEQMIGGVCDFTGELVRKAVNIADIDQLMTLKKYHQQIEQIAEELTLLGLRGKLRQKYDELERNLKKLEHILYDVRLKK